MDLASEIKDAFWDALTKQFSDKGLKKSAPEAGEAKNLEEQKNKIAVETSEQTQRELAASKVSSTPHKIIENYVAERYLIILANKDFQNYYNTHLIPDKKGSKSGIKLSAEDIKNAAIQIAQREFLSNPNAETVGMVANLPYEFNPATAPFREYLIDVNNKLPQDVKTDEKLKERAQAESTITKSSEDKKSRKKEILFKQLVHRLLQRLSNRVLKRHRFLGWER